MEHVPGADGVDPTLIFSQSSARQVLRETRRSPDGRVELTWNASGGRRMTTRYASELSRALLKSALECVWVDHGEATLDPDYDHVREVVLGKKRDGFLLMGAKPDPESTNVSLSYYLRQGPNGGVRLPVAASFFGVPFLTDSHLPDPGTEVPPRYASLITFSESEL